MAACGCYLLWLLMGEHRPAVEDNTAIVVEKCKKNFDCLYPSLDKSSTVVCPDFFEYDYKAPIDEGAAGHSRSAKKAEHIIRGDKAEQLVFRALQNSGAPMFVIRGLKITTFLQSIVKRNIPKEQCRELDFVIIHWEIGVLLVEVKSKDSKKNYQRARDELTNGEKIIQEIITALQSHSGQRFPVYSEIPVYNIYATPNDKLKEAGSQNITLDSTGLKNIPDWLKSNFSIATFNKENLELLHKLCCVLVGQRAEVTTSGLTRFSSKEIDSQSYLKQSHCDSNKKKKNQTEEQERNVVSTKDQPDLSILAEQFCFLNKEQFAVWEGPRHQIIDGTTGSGKTILLKYKALACAREGEQVRVYVPSQLGILYENFFKKHVVESKVIVRSFEILENIVDFLSCDQKCHIFIDEFQLSLPANVEIEISEGPLKRELHKTSDRYRWIACNKMQPVPKPTNAPDLPGQVSYLDSEQIKMLQQVLNSLQQLDFHRVELNTCVRSTRNIQEFVEWYITQFDVALDRPVFCGHNITGPRVSVYIVEQGNSDSNGHGVRVLKEDNLPKCAMLCGTVSASNDNRLPYDDIAGIIKKEIDLYYSRDSRNSIAVLDSEPFKMCDMLPAMNRQQIALSGSSLGSHAVYFGAAREQHSYEWDTVIVICGPGFLDQYTMFTRAISKLVVIFHGNKFGLHGVLLRS